DIDRHERRVGTGSSRGNVPRMDLTVPDDFSVLGALAERMGVQLIEAEPERIVGTMPVDGNTQPYGLLHGGASCVLAETLGSVGAYDLSWTLACATIGDGIAIGPWRLDFPGIDEAPYDRRWVARFLSAYANADESTAEALFGAAIADGKLPQCLLTLAGSAVA